MPETHSAHVGVSHSFAQIAQQSHRACQERCILVHNEPQSLRIRANGLENVECRFGPDDAAMSETKLAAHGEVPSTTLSADGRTVKADTG